MDKTVTVKMDIRSAAAVRQILFEHQKGYSYEFASERISDIRKVIQEFDSKIGSKLEEN